jgi:hypothetical protein
MGWGMLAKGMGLVLEKMLRRIFHKNNLNKYCDCIYIYINNYSKL